MNSSIISHGYWLNRRTGRLISIDDHAKDAAAHPERFKLPVRTFHKALDAAGIVCHQRNHGRLVITTEGQREIVIRRMLVGGFIRVRHETRQATLAWQFAGDPIDALERLHRFTKRRGVGITTLVTFTDIGLDLSVTERWGRFGQSQAVEGLIRTWYNRYDKPLRWS